jgi:hypothetical protein
MVYGFKQIDSLSVFLLEKRHTSNRNWNVSWFLSDKWTEILLVFAISMALYSQSHMAVSDTNKRHIVLFKLKSNVDVISCYKQTKSFDPNTASSEVGPPYQFVRRDCCMELLWPNDPLEHFCRMRLSPFCFIPPSQRRIQSKIAFRIFVMHW